MGSILDVKGGEDGLDWCDIAGEDGRMRGEGWLEETGEATDEAAGDAGSVGTGEPGCRLCRKFKLASDGGGVFSTSFKSDDRKLGPGRLTSEGRTILGIEI